MDRGDTETPQPTYRGMTLSKILERADKAVGGIEIPAPSMGSFVTSSVRQGGRDSLEDRIVIAETLSSELVKWPRRLEALYYLIDRATKKNKYGSTALTGVVTADRHIHLAHLGDCSAFLIGGDIASGALEFRKLTKEHHPQDPVERERINREGGLINERGRLVHNNGSRTAANSRSFGDEGFPGLGKEPDLIHVDLAAESAPQILLLLSDGVCHEERFPDAQMEEVCKFWTSVRSEISLPALLTAIAALQRNHENYSEDLTQADNMSAIAVDLTQPRKTDLILGVDDGHGDILTVNAVMARTQSLAYQTSRKIILARAAQAQR